MNATATFRGNFIPISSLCTSCCGDLRRIYALPISNIVSRNAVRCQSSKSIFRSGKRKFVCRVSETEIEPEGENDKDKQVHEDTEESPSLGPKVESNETVDSQPAAVDQTKNQPAKLDMLISDNVTVDSQPAAVDQTKNQLAKLDMLISDNVTVDSQPAAVDQTKNQLEKLGMLSSDNVVNNTAGETKAQDSNEDFDNIEVASGSPLPGVKLGDSERIPKETIEILKGQVFGFDTFFVTSQEPYEGGALFKGNLRGTAAESYEKINKRLQENFGDQYKLFLLNNPEDDKPVAVVVPRKILQSETTAVPEWFAAASFGVVTLFTLLLRNVPDLQSNLLSTFDNVNLLKDGLPGALVTALILGVHEISHILVAKSSGVKLGVPYFVPSWQIGSFGTITRIISIVPKREDLLKIAAAGPLAGFSLAVVLLLLGFIVPPSDGLGTVVDGSVFHESFLAGVIAKLFLGDALKEGTPVSLNPLVLWAWAGLLINAINSIPAGELDGGRISFALWGRKGSARLTGASIVLLGLSSLINDVAFYWVVLIFFLQRGPIAPLSEEITDPDNKYVALGIAVLFLGLLVCLPYPFPFTTEAIASF